LGENFVNLAKTGREDAKLLEMIFSHFAKKLRMGKPDSILLEMLYFSFFRGKRFPYLSVCILRLRYIGSRWTALQPPYSAAATPV
jgi:hypothetical protein